MHAACRHVHIMAFMSLCGHRIHIVMWKMHSKNSKDQNEMLAFKYPCRKHYGNKRWNTKLCNFIFWHWIFHYRYIMKIHPTPPPPCISVYIYIFIYMSLNKVKYLHSMYVSGCVYVIQKPYRYGGRNKSEILVINEHFVICIYGSIYAFLFIFRLNTNC